MQQCHVRELDGQAFALEAPLADAGALGDAEYCASDPLCSEGRPGLKISPNGAACHACLLASETDRDQIEKWKSRGMRITLLEAETNSLALKLSR